MKAPILFVALLAGCAGQQPLISEALRPGELQYVAGAADGARILEGTLHLEYPDDSTVSGSWSIQWVAGVDTTQQVGQQVGTGQLRGTRQGGALYLDLNPGWADNNVILQAAPAENGWNGTWGWDTIVGIQAGGEFSATSR